jgi:hypothetical protein
MIPHKHFATETISRVLEDEITSETFAGDHPCESTMIRWHMWLRINRTLIDGLLKSLAHRQLGFSEKLLGSADSLLDELKASYEFWLETIVRTIYNSGARLNPL